jgi:formylglycine-generating enzyme required for sulfatase activity
LTQAAPGPAELDAPLTPGGDTATVPQAFGRYRVRKRLSGGGFGDVYLAEDTELARLVALKVPRRDRFHSEQELTGFIEEARTTVRLEHPGVVPVHDVFRTDTQVVIVQRYVPGGDLRARMKSGPLGPERVAEMVAAIAEVVAFAHRKGFIHRDLKPNNILLDEQGQPLVADFGLAVHESIQCRRRGERSGTPSYMSPEQVRGETHRLDGRSDIWSLGVILYELLGGRRPFAGKDSDAVFDEIQHRDPKPLRQIDPRIPVELERICHKCLSKRVVDRYSNALDLADDLRHWLTRGRREAAAEMAPQKPQVVPRGLRSFGEEDADYFLDLLPGPRDRDGLPDSIRFWKTRIEDTDADRTFAVGVIYGPSGCGKSSLVKAGLLPRLAGHVVPIYVEATAADTEVRLMKRLRRVCPGMGTDSTLLELFASLREAVTLPHAGKVVVVLDQFEQWLHARRGEPATQLAQALRQCDGAHVQCLVLVRDDFWSATSRFMAELEVRPVEGHNLAFVDRFDPLHARRVLVEFGRAYGRLSADSDHVPHDQQAFLDRAVDELSQDGKVICVRLALFADMMKGRPWTTSNLRRVGGAEGLGATFLEETFSAATAPAGYRCRQAAIRAVLTALLPESGTDIKGGMRSHEELLRAAGPSGGVPGFEEVVRILDTELRLITPTDPEGRGSADEASSSQSEGPHLLYYQLTHDYLVPSLREWLARKQKETRRGRAQLCLAERAAWWNAKSESRRLPSWWEYVTIRLWCRRRSWTEPQRRMMRVAGRRYLSRGVALVAIAAVGLIVGTLIYGRSHARNLVNRLLEANTADVPRLIGEMAPYRRWTEPLLQQALAEVRDDARKELHVRLALWPNDGSQAGVLVDRLLAATPQELAIVREALARENAELAVDFWRTLEDPGQPQGRRLRAACALALFDFGSGRWETHAEDVTSWLTLESPSLVADWADLLQPVCGVLTNPLTTVFRDGTTEQQRINAAVVLAAYHRDDVAKLVELNAIAAAPQRQILAGALANHRAEAVRTLKTELDAAAALLAAEAKRLDLAQRVARAGALLVLLDESALARGAPVWQCLVPTDEPQVRTYLIHDLAASRVDPSLLIARLREECGEGTNRAEHKPGPPQRSIASALLLCLGEVEASSLGRRQRDDLVAYALAIYQSHPDPGVHAAAEWLIRRLGGEQELVQADRQLAGRPPLPGAGWYANSQGVMMVILGPARYSMGSPLQESGRRKNEHLHEELVERRFAISAKEVTNAQFQEARQETAAKDAFQRLRGAFQRNARAIPKEPAPECPVASVDLNAAMAYCVWLSIREGISDEQLCYEVDQDGYLRPRPDMFSRGGYRLPSEGEWEYACRAGSRTSWHCGCDERFVSYYAWCAKNANARSHPVGWLKPNDYGLFDAHGNVYEWCQDTFAADPDPSIEPATLSRLRVMRGGGFSSSESGLRSAFRTGNELGAGLPNLGLRIAKTLSP